MVFDFLWIKINSEPMILILKIFMIYLDLHLTTLAFTAWLGLLDTDLIYKLYIYCIAKKRYSFLLRLFIIYPENNNLGFYYYFRAAAVLTLVAIISIVATVFLFIR